MELRFGSRSGALDLDLHEFTDPHGLDRAQTVVVNGFADGDPLRVENALFGQHDDLGFHVAGETMSGLRKFNGKPEAVNGTASSRVQGKSHAPAPPTHMIPARNCGMTIS